MLKFFLLVITDFEDSMVVAVQKVFPETHLSGCYFRFAQELFKKWAECNLGNIYGDDKGQTGNIARMTFRFFLFLGAGLEGTRTGWGGCGLDSLI